MSKLIDIQKDLKVLKTEINSYGGYNYRTTEGILLALKPLLVLHGCILTISDDIRAIGEHVYVEARATLKCDDEIHTGSSFGRDPIVQKGMSAPQCTNSASSFARKQCLSGLFLLDDTATPILSQDEQIEEQDKIDEQKKESEDKAQKTVDEFLDKALHQINESLSDVELKAVYSAMYRSAQKMGKEVAGKVEGYYKNKKEEMK